MKVIDFSKSNTVINKYISELRDVNQQGKRLTFRNNIVRIGHAMAYEASKLLTYGKESITTPLGVSETSLPQDDIVLATVFRAGLPMHQGFLDVFDNAENAFVSAYRYYKDRDAKEIGIKIEYIASPNLDDKTLIIVDPMLATGGSFELAYRAFLTNGKPARLIMACVIASKQGVDYLRKAFPDNDVILLCGAIDPELNEHKYIVPGLGDAGDLMYGEKL